MTRKIFLFSLIPFLYLLLMLFQVEKSFMSDLGRHIKMGEIIDQCRCVPETNIFSLNYPDFETINHSWLSSLIFFRLTEAYGLTSLLYLKLVLVITSFTIIYCLSLRKEALFTSVMMSSLYLAMFSQRFTVRPELFSFLFIALFLWLFDLYNRTQKPFLLWFIPAILILWVNTHIYFFVGVLLALFFSLDNLLIKKGSRKLFILLICGIILAPLINPTFIHGAVYPFLIFQNYAAPILENYSPLQLLTYYHPFSSQFFVIVLFELFSCIVLAGVLLYPRRQLIAEKLQIVLAIALGQYLIRCMAIFSLISLPFLTKQYVFILQKTQPHIKKHFMYGCNVALVMGFLLIFFLQLQDIGKYYTPGFSYIRPAESGVNFFLKNHLHGPIFNNFSLGNYLIYRLYPQEKVFIDGRPEAYPETSFQEHLMMLKDISYFNKQADRYNINVVFYSTLDYPELSSSFLLKLAQDRKWMPIFWDGNIIIFVRNNAPNAKLISENKEVKTLFLKEAKSW